MARKSELYWEVEKLNDKYCKNTKNKLKVNEAYGGYSVMLTGKRSKKTGKLLKGAMTGASSVGNEYHGSVRETLDGLYKADYMGWIKSTIKYYEHKNHYKPKKK